MTTWVRGLGDIGPLDAGRFGHKAARLGVLRRAAFPVPDGFGVSGDAFDAHAKRALGPRWWETTEDEHAAGQVLAVDLDPELVRQVSDAYEALGDGDPLVAVRSSSTVEDAARTSGAGVQESVIGVVGVARVLDSMRTVWASLFSRNAQAYYGSRRSAGAPPVLVGVVVQVAVVPDVAGVLFTVDPITGNAGEIVVNAAFGLGEGVVGGQVSPDTFVVDKRGLTPIRRSIATKPFKLSIDASGRRRVRLSPRRARAPSLSDDQVRAVAALGREVERHLGMPTDVEWALADDTVYLVQARPITTTPDARERHDAPPGRSGDVWTNANVGEALPGVATPLTWSVAARYSERGFRRAFAALGCVVPHGAVLVARFRGRIYLNLTQFIEIASQLPLLSPQVLAELGGARWPSGLEPRRRPLGLVAGVRFVTRLPAVVGRLVSQHARVERQVEGLEERVAAASARLARRDLGALDEGQIARELHAVDDLLETTGDAMLTCGAHSLGSFLLLRHLLSRWLGDEAKGLDLEIVSGAADLESAKPGIALWHMAEAVKGDADAARILRETEASELQVSSFPTSSRLRRDLEAFQAAHGFRAVREAELMTPRWSEEPTLIFAALKEHLRSGGIAPDRAYEARLAARRSAEKRVEASLSPGRRAVVRRLASLARRHGRLRERLRARVTQVLGLYRTIALEVSARLGCPDAAFFLTIEEVYRALDGSIGQGTTVIGPLVATRRLEHERFLSLPDPPSTLAGSPPDDVEGAMPVGEGDHVLQGVPAGPGCAAGPARIIRDPRDAESLRAGEVLVVRCADVGWSPLFLFAGALVTELGGVLSHAAVVAREYGVPAVVGVDGATKIIQNGTRLLVDGDHGRVVVRVTD